MASTLGSRQNSSVLLSRSRFAQLCVDFSWGVGSTTHITSDTSSLQASLQSNRFLVHSAYDSHQEHIQALQGRCIALQFSRLSRQRGLMVLVVISLLYGGFR